VAKIFNHDLCGAWAWAMEVMGAWQSWQSWVRICGLGLGGHGRMAIMAIMGAHLWAGPRRSRAHGIHGNHGCGFVAWA